MKRTHPKLALALMVATSSRIALGGVQLVRIRWAKDRVQRLSETDRSSAKPSARSASARGHTASAAAEAELLDGGGRSRAIKAASGGGIDGHSRPVQW